jgi:hypothetical protein
VYHNNNYKNTAWINKCVNSIFSQSFCEFDIHELNYSNEDVFYFKNYIPKIKGNFFSYKKFLSNSLEAMNYLLEYCFNKLNYDIVFNIDLYDYYEHERFIYQLNEIEKGSYLCSSLCYFVETVKGVDQLINNDNTMLFDKEIRLISNKEYKQPMTPTIISPENVAFQINKNQNIIMPSGLCFTKQLWDFKDKLGNPIRFRNDFPFHFFSFFKRCIDNGIKISIVNRNQIFKRIHYEFYPKNKPPTIENLTELTEKNNSYLEEIIEYSPYPNFTSYQIVFLIKFTTYSELFNILKIKFPTHISISYYVYNCLIPNEDFLEDNKILKEVKFFDNTFDDCIKIIGHKLYLISDYIIIINDILNPKNIEKILKIEETDDNEFLSLGKEFKIIRTNKFYYEYFIIEKNIIIDVEEISETQTDENIKLEINPV